MKSNEESATDAASWADTFSSFWTSASSSLVLRAEDKEAHHSECNNETEDIDTATDAAPACRQCAYAVDTTPPNDLTQFQRAVQVMTGTPNNGCRIAPSLWQKTNTCVTEIPYFRQLETWDCGVACLQMILAWLRNEDSNVSAASSNNTAHKEERQWMLDSLGTRSIWTIDLLMLLHSIICKGAEASMIPSSCSYLLCSKTLGVDREHNRLRYYEKAFGKDSVRVNRLFSEANKIGLNLLCLSHLGLAQVIRLVAQPNIVALLLLDNTILLRNKNAAINASSSARSLFRRTTTTKTSSYAGHYVVLCGMSCDPLHVERAKQASGDPHWTDDYCMVIKNPGSGNDETEYVTPYLLETAWRAKGTDDDVIFVMKTDQPGQGDN